MITLASFDIPSLDHAHASRCSCSKLTARHTHTLKYTTAPSAGLVLASIPAKHHAPGAQHLKSGRRASHAPRPVCQKKKVLVSVLVYTRLIGCFFRLEGSKMFVYWFLSHIPYAMVASGGLCLVMINATTLIIRVGFLHLCLLASRGVSSSSVGVAKTGRHLFTRSLRHFVVYNNLY